MAAAMLLPFLALCLIPPTAMLDRDSSRSLVLVLCSGDGPVEMTVDLGSGTPQTNQRCDWALAHDTVLEAPPFALPTGEVSFQRATPARAATLWHPAYDPRDLWARGPPILV